MKVIVIIPAAGLGTRMAPAGKKTAASKQFFEIEGAPIIVHTLRVFARNPRVAQIVVALRNSEKEQFKRYLGRENLAAKVVMVEGGEHRQRSVGNALAQLQAAPDDVVLVHDAVRPFVDDEIVENVICEVEKHGAAIAGLPAVHQTGGARRRRRDRYLNHLPRACGTGADSPGIPLRADQTCIQFRRRGRLHWHR